ncbi:hypothetical protein E2562_018075 [Oryza meyeriana var. granulata]|uniref:Uncharacterized protein n=1 Tax=Oryza meyeriana var. granulata TaxID=110450 RepID=A0A6G1CR36_9ORYZ|nr:hypothetical protein E2562_018075 [Oryza meyeriana var. granulata]
MRVLKGANDTTEVIELNNGVDVLRAVYEGAIPYITDKSQWPTADKGFKLLPPVPKPRTEKRDKENCYKGWEKEECYKDFIEGS